MPIAPTLVLCSLNPAGICSTEEEVDDDAVVACAVPVVIVVAARPKAEATATATASMAPGRKTAWRCFTGDSGVVRDGPYRVLTRPPSMTTSDPVMLSARSLAKDRTRSATSSGWVNRPVTASPAARSATARAVPPVARATVAATPSSASHRPGVTGPGLTVFTRTPCGPTCLDSDLQKLDSAALAAL